jgi:hypothetical protein
VDWWNTLHQGGTFLDPGFQIHASASMSWTFLLGFIAFSLIFVWLLGVRYRVALAQDAVGDRDLEVTLAERWSEGSGEQADAGSGDSSEADLIGAGLPAGRPGGEGRGP